LLQFREITKQSLMDFLKHLSLRPASTDSSYKQQAMWIVVVYHGNWFPGTIVAIENYEVMVKCMEHVAHRGLRS
jgi:hypothetical protein